MTALRAAQFSAHGDAVIELDDDRAHAGRTRRSTASREVVAQPVGLFLILSRPVSVPERIEAGLWVVVEEQVRSS